MSKKFKGQERRKKRKREQPTTEIKIRRKEPKKELLSFLQKRKKPSKVSQNEISFQSFDHKEEKTKWQIIGNGKWREI